MGRYLCQRAEDDAAVGGVTPCTLIHALSVGLDNVSGQDNALTRGKTGQGIVEVAGIEPASSGFSMGLLRAQPVLGCRERLRHRQRCHSVSD